MAHIIAIANNKGGASKTTTACNLADALSRRGRKVLVVDCDAQCNATSILLPATTTPRKTLYDILDLDNPSPDIAQAVYISKCGPGVRILPNIETTSCLEPDMIRRHPESVLHLGRVLRPYVEGRFDYVIIDTPPNLGTFVLCGLFAADFAMVPIRAGSAFSVDGLIAVMKLIKDIREHGSSDLRFLKLLITCMDRRTTTSRDISTSIQESFEEDLIFKTVIPVNTVFEKAEISKETIFRYDGTAPGARAYRELADEVIELLEASE